MTKARLLAILADVPDNTCVLIGHRDEGSADMLTSFPAVELKTAKALHADDPPLTFVYLYPFSEVAAQKADPDLDPMVSSRYFTAQGEV